MAATAQRVTKSWLASEGRRYLLVHVPERCEPSFATEADLAELARMSQVAFGETALKPSVLKRYFRVGHALVVTLRRQARIVGYCLAELNLRQRRVYVVETCVGPADKGQGYAVWLRARVDAIARARGYRSLTSHVRVDNHAAFALNRRCGMSVVDRIGDYYEDGSEAFYLRKLLPSDLADDEPRCPPPIGSTSS